MDLLAINSLTMALQKNSPYILQHPYSLSKTFQVQNLNDENEVTLKVGIQELISGPGSVDYGSKLVEHIANIGTRIILTKNLKKNPPNLKSCSDSGRRFI